MGNHHANGAIIQDREDAVSIRPRNPYQPGCAEGACSEQAHFERLARPGRMLFVQHDEVIAERTEDLSRVRGRCFTKSTDQQLASEESFAELAWRRACCVGSHG